MIVEIIDSILSKVSNEGASGNDAFIQTFQELGVLGEVQYDYEQKMGKYCSFSSEFSRFLMFNSEYAELLGKKAQFDDCEPDTEWSIFFFNENKDWKDYMYLVKVIGPYREHLKEQAKVRWANKIWDDSHNINLPPVVKKCKPNWCYDIDGVICIIIGCSNCTWTSQVDPFVLYPVIPLNEEKSEQITQEDIWLIEDINILDNTIEVRIGSKRIQCDFKLFNDYQLANWKDVQLAEYVKVLQEFIVFPPF